LIGYRQGLVLTSIPVCLKILIAAQPGIGQDIFHEISNVKYSKKDPAGLYFFLNLL
jgi:hypothetical protein